MTMGAQSAVAYRPLITESLATLQIVNSSPLPDGACAFVTGTRQLFRFRKTSTKTVVAGVVIAPGAGGGRWVLEGPTAGALAAFVAASNTNETAGTESTDWIPTSTAAYALATGSGAWTLTASELVLTYSGPAARYLLTLTTTLTFNGPATAQIAIAQNEDITGTEAGYAEGAEFVETPLENGVTEVLSSQRSVTLAPGDIIQPMFRVSSMQLLNIERLTLSALPLP